MIPLVLVDGHNLLWRAAYGFPSRILGKDGSNQTTLFGFFALVCAAIKRVNQSAEWIVCFDGEWGTNVRREEYSQYKLNRTNASTEPIQALPGIKEGLESVGIQWVELDEHEADDLISTFVERDLNRMMYILSTDKDFYQLITDRVFVLNTARKATKCVIDVKEVMNRYEVTPSQWCDFMALTGDSSDNIQGVRGIGPVTAARLLSGGLRLEDLENMGRLRGRVGALVSNQLEQLFRTRDIMRFRPVPDLPDIIEYSPTHPLDSAASVLRSLQIW